MTITIAQLERARALVLESPHLRFTDPPALAIDRFIDVLLGGDGANAYPLPPDADPNDDERRHRAEVYVCIENEDGDRGHMSTAKSGDPWIKRGRGAVRWGRDDYALWRDGRMLAIAGRLLGGVSEKEAREFIATGVTPRPIDNVPHTTPKERRTTKRARR